METGYRAWPFWLFILLALMAYVSPWVINPGAGLTVGAYDLAEWVSLSPAARAQSPALLTTFLLRLPLMSLTLLIALNAPRSAFTYRRWLHTLAVLPLCVAQLPPPEFLSQTDDINYRQQALLAGGSLILAIIGLSGALHRYRLPVMVAVAGVSAVAVLAGLFQAQDILRQYKLPAETGFGGILLALLFALLAGAALYRLVKSNRAIF